MCLLFYFNHHCHRSAFIISWLKMVVLSVCLSLVLFFPQSSAPRPGPWLVRGRALATPAWSQLNMNMEGDHAIAFPAAAPFPPAYRPQFSAVAGGQGQVIPQGRDSLLF